MLTLVTQIKPKHSKDGEELVVTALFLTSDHQLIVRGYCSKCLVSVDVICTLTELHENCPEEEDPEITEADKLRMHALGITPPPDTPLLAPPNPS